jgi:hypothetical protein
MRNAYTILVRKHEEKRPSVYGRILKWILKKWNVREGLRKRPSRGLVTGNESPDSIKSEESFDQLGDYQHLKSYYSHFQMCMYGILHVHVPCVM